MDDAVTMRGRDGARDVGGDGESLTLRQGALGNDLREVLPVHQLHGEVGLFVERETHVVNVHDARIADTRGELRLRPEATRIGRRRLDFQGDTAIEPPLDGLPHDAHAAPADDLQELVARDPRLVAIVYGVLDAAFVSGPRARGDDAGRSPVIIRRKMHHSLRLTAVSSPHFMGNGRHTRIFSSEAGGETNQSVCLSIGSV